MNIKTVLQLVLIISLITSVTAPPPAPPWTPGSLQSVAAALGVLLLVIMGLRWIIAESPQEREEAKKGMLYIVTGLLIVYSYDLIICDLYCTSANVAAAGGCPTLGC